MTADKGILQLTGLFLVCRLKFRLGLLRNWHSSVAPQSHHFLMFFPILIAVPEQFSLDPLLLPCWCCSTGHPHSKIKSQTLVRQNGKLQNDTLLNCLYRK